MIHFARMARPSLSQADVDSFRDLAVTAALEIVEDEGTVSLTLRGLAARLGCSYTKLYRYFRDKEQLVDAVRGRAFDMLADFVGKETEGPFDRSRFPHIRDLYLRFAFEHKEAFRIMFELRQDYISPQTRAAEARAWEVCARPLHKAVEAGELEGDPELIAHVAWAALHGLASLALADKLHHGKDFAEVAAGLRAVIDGFRPGAAFGAREKNRWLN